MVDLGVALTWIALSAASVKGLSVLARAVARGDADAEAAALAGEGMSAPDELYWIGSSPRLPFRPRDPTLPVLAVGDRPSSGTPVDVDAASV
jgi:hypothetical protein